MAHDNVATRGNRSFHRETLTVRQQATEVQAGGNLTLAAGQDLTLVASAAQAGGEAYLYAGRDLALLAAQDQDYFLYDKKKKGSFGGKQTRRDEITTVTQVGSRVEAEGNLTLESGEDQRYQVASLKSGANLTLDAGGDITFEGVKDLKQESHEKSSSDWAWTSMKGKGSTDETLRQSELVAAGKLVIEAAGKIRIDIPEVNQQTVTQTIAALVEAEPQLAWLKEMESRGDIDWQRVKEVHDQWKYSHSGMGQVLTLIIAIVVTALTWGAASSAIAGAANAGAGSAAAAAGSTMAVGGAVNTGLTAAVTSIASSAAINTINSGGDLGKALEQTFSEDAIKGYLTSAVVAGITTGLIDNYFTDKSSTGTNASTTVDVDVSKAGQTSVSASGPSFDLNSWEGVGKFAAYQGSKAIVSAGVDSAINGGSFEEKLAASLTSAAVHVVSAAAFNEIGELTSLKDGSIEKVAVKALVGGLISQAATGDFATGALAAGALAAGANEALIIRLAPLVDDDPALISMASQLVGAVSSVISGGDPNLASDIAGYATQYNYLSHRESEDLEAALQRRDACGSDANCRREAQSTIDELRALDKTRDFELAEACKNPSSPACQVAYADLIVATNSYKGQVDDGFYSIVSQEGLSAQTLATQYGARITNPTAFNAGTGAIEALVAELAGTVELAALATQAAAGNLYAQAQLGGMIEALGDFLQNPVDGISQNIRGTLDEADRLEANGQVDEAARLRAGLVTSGILAITGNGKVVVRSSGSIVGEVPAKKIAGVKATGTPVVDAEEAALDRIAQNPNGPDLTGKQSGTVLQAQSQKRIDDLAVQYNTKSIAPNDFQLNLGDKVLKTDPEVSKGAPVYMGATTSDVMSYFRQLAGIESMPLAKAAPGKGTIYTAKTDAGARITLRDFSTSSQQTGASWTIDIMDKSINGGRKVEIKFK